MENGSFSSIEQVDDISTLDEYQVALSAGLSKEEALKAVNRFSRDNARTPFQWDSSAHGGFTKGTPWLFVNPNYTRINAKAQLADPDSILHYYQKMIALRKNPAYQETLVYGDCIPLWENRHNLMAYYRKSEAQTLLIAGNFQKEPQTVVLDAVPKQVLLNNLSSFQLEEQTLTLDGYQAVILEL